MEKRNQETNNITLETARFILDQAEKHMQATIDTSKMITDRAVTIMQFSIPLSVALTGLIIAEPAGQFIWFYVVTLGMLLTITSICLNVYDSFDALSLGNKPESLFRINTTTLTSRGMDMARILYTLEELGKAIERNEKDNQVRQNALFLALSILKLLASCTLLLFAMGLPILLFGDLR